MKYLKNLYFNIKYAIKRYLCYRLPNVRDTQRWHLEPGDIESISQKVPVVMRHIVICDGMTEAQFRDEYIDTVHDISEHTVDTFVNPSSVTEEQKKAIIKDMTSQLLMDRPYIWHEHEEKGLRDLCLVGMGSLLVKWLWRDE